MEPAIGLTGHCHEDVTCSRAAYKPTSVAFLPFVGPTFNHISRVLSRHNIRTVDLMPRRVTNFLQPIKDDNGFKTPGIYGIPCKFEKVYIEQTGHAIETRIKGHHCHIRLYHPDKSAEAKHSINQYPG
jgi:hypothetical protein